MQEGTPWTGNNVIDHPRNIQNGGLDTNGKELPRLVYVYGEKKCGFKHHKKAGAMNALMCFMMDPTLEKTIRYVQFPQRLDGIDTNDPYANRNTVSLMGGDGILCRCKCKLYTACDTVNAGETQTFSAATVVATPVDVLTRKQPTQPIFRTVQALSQVAYIKRRSYACQKNT
uniref:Uncharacterized protein n=1 Tax=Solanum lycopersicum TaxID=4081 RepID=A0A3Q7IXL9_SOLLC